MAGLKTNDNQQFALVATNDARPVPLTSGEGIEPLADPDGRLYVLIAGTVPPAPGSITYYDNAGAFAQQSLAVVSAAPAALIRVYGFKAGPGTEYVQLYDLAAGPPGAAIPFAQFPVEQDAAFSLDFANGRQLTTGLVVALSTTSTLYTAAPATMWLNAELS